MKSPIANTMMAISFSTLAACVNVANQNSAEISCDVDYSARKTAELEDIEAGEAVIRRVIQEGLSEKDVAPEEIARVERMESVLADRARPVDNKDLAIIDGASRILSNPRVWNRADDRQCELLNMTFSLFCALQTSSINTIGVYEHRRTALQEVRFAIEDVRPEANYEHRMQDFNNAPDTTFADAKGVLATAAAKIRDRLNLQTKCAL